MNTVPYLTLIVFYLSLLGIRHLLHRRLAFVAQALRRVGLLGGWTFLLRTLLGLRVIYGALVAGIGVNLGCVGACVAGAPQYAVIVGSLGASTLISVWLMFGEKMARRSRRLQGGL